MILRCYCILQIVGSRDSVYFSYFPYCAARSAAMEVAHAESCCNFKRLVEDAAPSPWLRLCSISFLDETEGFGHEAFWILGGDDEEPCKSRDGGVYVACDTDWPMFLVY
jgi:hypothetical protein